MGEAWAGHLHSSYPERLSLTFVDRPGKVELRGELESGDTGGIRGAKTASPLVHPVWMVALTTR